MFLFFSFLLLASNLFSTPRFLITGCGRSGTTYITKVLQNNGVPAFHERCDADCAVSWKLLFEKDRKKHYQVVLHQIRNPLDCISSMTTAGANSWKFIQNRIPEISPADPIIVKSAKYWYYWNKRAESISSLSYPIEHLSTYLPAINRLLKIDIKYETLTQISNTTNTRKHCSITWEYLRKNLPKELFNNIQAYAKKYGYLSND